METKPEGPYALGRTIRVWWDGDKKFYTAKVKKFIPSTNKHIIQYVADNFVEEQDLSNKCVEFFKIKNEKEVAENTELWKLYFARLHPNAPKKPKTAYNLYLSAKMKELTRTPSSQQRGKVERKKDTLTLSKKEYINIIRENWKKADPKEKMPYIIEAKQRNTEYESILHKYLENMPIGGYPLPAPRERELVNWQRKKIDECPNPKWKIHVREVLKDGYTLFPNVLSKEIIHQFLHNSTATAIETTTSNINNTSMQNNIIQNDENCSHVSPPRRKLRKRSASQVWKGAIATMNAHINRVGDRITVKAPVCVRSAGRYDMELNTRASKPIYDSVTDVVNFVQFLLNRRGSIKTQNVMLSEPGSVTQPIHTDSNWEGHRQRDPRPHYFTILIPFTDQDLETGGTRVYPGTHRDAKLGAKTNGGTIEGVENPQKAGDALVFDGLLQHHGTENVTGQKKKIATCNDSNGNSENTDVYLCTQKRNRYFYYMAIAIGADPNTYVTGKSGTFKKHKRK